MSKKVKPIPEGYHTVTPYLMIRGAAQAVDFYTRAFGAKELSRNVGPEGKVMHGEMQIGNSRIMFADEFPEIGALSPTHYGGCPVLLHLYVDDVDTVYEKAIAAGAKVLRPLKTQFYGDRSAILEDSFGYRWNVSTRVEDLSDEEIQKRAAKEYSDHK